MKNCHSGIVLPHVGFNLLFFVRRTSRKCCEMSWVINQYYCGIVLVILWARFRFDVVILVSFRSCSVELLEQILVILWELYQTSMTPMEWSVITKIIWTHMPGCSFSIRFPLLDYLQQWSPKIQDSFVQWSSKIQDSFVLICPLGSATGKKFHTYF
jgi:hypothetical protein